VATAVSSRHGEVAFFSPAQLGERIKQQHFDLHGLAPPES
jgi:hypothetical protein